MSLGGDVLAQPAGDGAAAAADLQAAYGRAQAELPDPASGHRVETFGEKVQATAFAGFGVRERVVRCVLSHLFVLHTRPPSAETGGRARLDCAQRQPTPARRSCRRPGLTLEQAERDFVIAMDWGTYRTLTGELGLTPSQVRGWIRSYYQCMFLSRAQATPPG
jgi:hypothetical protein